MAESSKIMYFLIKITQPLFQYYMIGTRIQMFISILYDWYKNANVLPFILIMYLNYYEHSKIMIIKPVSEYGFICVACFGFCL